MRLSPLFKFSLRRLVLAVAFGLPCVAMAADATTAQILERLDKLEKSQAAADAELKNKDIRIRELEAQLQHSSGAAVSDSAVPDEKYYGDFTPGGAGFRVANTKYGALNLSVYSYLRYLNQSGLDDSYVDGNGNAQSLDKRNDIQIQKVLLYFKGWVYDPNLRYVFYTWTSNTSQGDSAQVVVAGYLRYAFDKTFNLAAGIGGLPNTRSMEGQWPSFLKVDYRTITDEYFRGSYTTGIFADGELAEGLQYKVMLGNNLSQLGVSGSQLDDGLNTVAGALWWMPTTGEFGPGQGFGDYEFHENLATRIGVHYSESRETAQSQPGSDITENTQIRTSDGRSLFSPGSYAAGVDVDKARYRMSTLDAGMKYRGYALEGEYFMRWIDDIKANGALPFSNLTDQGFQLQASMMAVPKTLQFYLSGSKIMGEYGDPYDIALGGNWYPYKEVRSLRVNAELMQLSHSPVGYTSVPFAVGGNGLVFTTHVELAF
ncbi:MAG: hypothetical protein ACRERR_03750 [Moraxellaceae bacterium]